MEFLFLLLVQLLLLYYLSKNTKHQIYRLFFRLTKSKETAVYLFSLIFAPGTFFHELFHFLSALILLVPVGQMDLIPKIDEKGFQLGSVPVAKTDPIRRTLIGIAPFLLGIISITVSVYLFVSYDIIYNWWALLILFYISFQIGNTMFLSKKDLEGAYALIVVVGFVFVILWYLKVNIFTFINSFFTKDVEYVLLLTNIFMFFPLISDFIVLILLKIGKSQN